MNQKDDGNWGIGLMAIAGIILAIFGTDIAWLGIIAFLALAIGFFKWFWFS